MKLDSKKVDGVKILVLQGKIMGDPKEVSLADAIVKSADEGDVKVVLDFTDVTWMNSLGLGMCIAGFTTLRNRGGDLRLCCCSKPVQTLIKNCNLQTVFEIFDSSEEAIKSFH